ncbi:hypothetical protein QUA44_26985 [Microcoleus sp. N9_A2]
MQDVYCQSYQAGDLSIFSSDEYSLPFAFYLEPIVWQFFTN